MSFPRYPEYKDSGVEWLGEVPAHWEVVRLGYFASSQSGGTPPKENLQYWNGEIPWVTPKDMKAERLSSSQDKVTEQAITNTSLAIIDPGHLLLVFRSGVLRHTLPIAINDAPTTINQDIRAYDVSARLIPEFFLRLVQGNNRALIFEWSKQGATVESLESELVRSTHVPIPPWDEQQIITAFLDHETARIDALIAEQQRLIELLKEKRQAVISHAVTKGLEPNVPMKDSGVEWLGEVPAHWEVLKLGFVTLEKCDGPFGSALKSEHYTDEGVRVIRLQNIKKGYFNDTDAAYIDSEYYREKIGRSEVKADDLLIAGLGDDNNSVGRACVAPKDIEPAMVKADCFRFRLNTRIAMPSFVAEQLSAGSDADAGLLSSGSTRSRIALTVMSTRIIALPPTDEQHAILERIDKLKGELESLLRESKAAIELLNERRSALISAAITGKIDVRAWQAESPFSEQELPKVAEHAGNYTANEATP